MSYDHTLSEDLLILLNADHIQSLHELLGIKLKETSRDIIQLLAYHKLTGQINNAHLHITGKIVEGEVDHIVGRIGVDRYSRKVLILEQTNDLSSINEQGNIIYKNIEALYGLNTFDQNGMDPAIRVRINWNRPNSVSGLISHGISRGQPIDLITINDQTQVVVIRSISQGRHFDPHEDLCARTSGNVHILGYRASLRTIITTEPSVKITCTGHTWSATCTTTGVT